MAPLNKQQFGDYTLKHETEDWGERKPRHDIRAEHNGEIVGNMNWYGTTGTISNIDVEPEHSRKGIATAMWNMGQDFSPKPKHSNDRTSMGDAWSKKVGGKRPKNKALK